MMELSKYDKKYIRVTDIYGETHIGTADVIMEAMGRFRAVGIVSVPFLKDVHHVSAAKDEIVLLPQHGKPLNDFYSASPFPFTKSLTTSPARISPTTEGTKAMEPGISLRCVHFLAVPGGQIQ